MLKAALAVIFGSLLIGIGINSYFVPYHILDGGMIGLGLIFHYIWDIPTGITILILSIPIYLAAWKYYRTFFYNSIAGLIVSALFIDILSTFNWHFFQLAPLPSAIVGGVILGIGVGIMFRYRISTGGLDLFAQMLAAKFTVNIGLMIFVVDFLVVVGGLFVITPSEFLLSVIAVAATGFATTLLTLDNKAI